VQGGAGSAGRCRKCREGRKCRKRLSADWGQVLFGT